MTCLSLPSTRARVSKVQKRAHRSCPSYSFQRPTIQPLRSVASNLGTVSLSSEVIDDADKKKVEELFERFRMADADGSGSIDRNELRLLLESVDGGRTYFYHTTTMAQHWLSEEELDTLMARYDKDNSGTITFDEFQQIVYDGILLDGTLQEYEAAFNAVDRSGNGTIGATELAALFTSLGKPMSMEKLVDIFQKYDKDESGQIDFGEFLRMFREKVLDLNAMAKYIADFPAGTLTDNIVDTVEGDLTLIFSEQELDAILRANKEKVVVLFSALTWCRPCKAMQRPVQKMADAYRSSAVFVKLFGNANIQTKLLFKDRLQIRSTPSFIMFKGGERVFSMTGSNKEKLEAALRELIPAEKLTSTALYPLDGSGDE